MLNALCMAKRLHDGVWVCGNLVVDSNGEPHIVESKYVEMDGHHINIDSDTPVFFIPETVRWYTGRDIRLHNGTNQRIFSGDIIFARYSRLLVDWDKDFLSFWTYYFNTRGEKVRLSPLADIAPWELGSVIGNIYDNPNLVYRGEM